MPRPKLTSNFTHLQEHDEQLLRLGMLAERLTPAILAKAFRGELVPQDPNDEPAAALLARLAGQAAEAPRKRARTKSPARS